MCGTFKGQHHCSRPRDHLGLTAAKQTGLFTAAVTCLRLAVLLSNTECQTNKFTARLFVLQENLLQG